MTLLRDQALAVARQAIRNGDYWLPAPAQAAVVDAVLEVTRRPAVTFQIRIDAARDWARRTLPADQVEQLLGILRGDETSPTAAEYLDNAGTRPTT